jgi:hypothetical protein
MGHPWEQDGLSWCRQQHLLTNARPTVSVEGVLLVAATHGARICVLAAVLAASVSIVTGY